MKTLEHGKLYDSKQIVKMLGLRKFQDMLASGRLSWITDNSFGDKLYRLAI